MPEIGDIVRASDLEANKPQLSIGTVTTGAAGTNASASISGTSPNFKLNLTIPRGNTGATGATGPQGPSGTYTGPLKPTSSYWRVAISGDTKARIPSGGTWAYCSTYFTAQVVSPPIGVVAGGTLLQGNNEGEEYICEKILCWRIQ